MAKSKKNVKNDEIRKISVRPVEEVNIADFCLGVMQIHGANVNLARAVPDALDGLKPVHRRVLYTMFKDEKMKPHKDKKGFVKVAKVVGTTLGKYHPRLGGF